MNAPTKTVIPKIFFPALFLAAALTFTGCDATGYDPDSLDELVPFSESGAPYITTSAKARMRTHYGPARPLGTGTARTFVTFGAEGEPDALGVILSEKALVGLPEHGDHEENMMALAFPVQVQQIPFEHVSLDWNPHGHEPEGLFTLPHFDVHFYTVTEAERATWTPADAEWDEKVSRAPAAAYMPAGYMQLPGGVPMMGAHWIDTADPTYVPGGPTFTEVFIWGSYDGRVAFLEPMITTAFLETRPAFVEELVQPASFQQSAYYPTRYSIRYNTDRKAYVIALEGLTFRQAG